MKRSHQLIVPMLLPVALVSVIGLRFLVGETPPPMSAVAWAQSSPAGALDHFQCYEVKPGVFTSQIVTVTTKFGPPLAMTLRFPHALCNPTNKNGEGIVDPTDHLVGYQTKAPKFIKQTNKTFVDQFGTLTLDLVRPQFLLVPSSKDGVTQQDPLDHFQCFKVKKSKGAPKFVRKTVNIANQFETTTLTLTKPYKVCVPADKNGEDPTAPDHPQSLVCYKTKGTKLGGSTHTIDNQFGLDELTVIHRRELCVPSPPTPTTTTTTTSTTTTTIATTTTTTTSTTTTTIATTTTTTTSTTTTTLYGSPSRAFLLPSVTLLD